jgi:soluble lytic murein transglycosylase-like protein
MMKLALSLAAAALMLAPAGAAAGPQSEAHLSATVQAGLTAAVADVVAPALVYPDEAAQAAWLAKHGSLVASRLTNVEDRESFLTTVYYEATRAGLDPELVLALILVESNLRKYAVSKAGARGYMQVMLFWVKAIGKPTDNLFHLRTNLRYGCTILRHYLLQENWNLFLALGRYNGSRGKAEYPDMVMATWAKVRAARGEAKQGIVDRSNRDEQLYHRRG